VIRGRKLATTFASSPSDWRGIRNKLAEGRRLIRQA
jgi:hypothetical protein